MPIGRYGSLPHILTNKKLDSKKATLADCAKANLKGMGKTYLAAGATLGAGAGSAVVAKRFFPNLVNTAKTKLSNILGSINISDVEGNISNLKEVLKNAEIVKSFRSLPVAAKGAIAAILALPLVGIYMCEKTKGNVAAAEAKHEVK